MTKRHAIRAAVVTALGTISGLGSVNRYARAADQVNDAPSLDVLVAGEQRRPMPSGQASRSLEVVVRCFGRHGDDDELDTLTEAVEAKVRADPTLGGIVVDVFATEIATDEGWLGFAGIGSMAEVRFTARWESDEAT